MIVSRKVAIVGSSFHQGAGNWIMKMSAGTGLRLQREPSNKHDVNAISVHIFHQCLGYVPRGLAAELAPMMDTGFKIVARKADVVGAVMVLTWEEPDVVLEAPANETANMRLDDGLAP